MGKPIRGRVGRHANTGAQCQNWAEDQQTIINMLNVLPLADGGPEAGILGKVVNGMASDALYKAILRFQKLQFPAQQIGFIEPGGPILAKLDALASRPSPDSSTAPRAAGQWGTFKTDSVRSALERALIKHQHLSQVDVVEIVRSALRDGELSGDALDDLDMILNRSKSIMPRSQAFLKYLVDEARSAIKALGPLKFYSRQQWAADDACAFLKRIGGSYWPNLDRDEVGVGMLLRIAKPGLLRQGAANVCGPAAMLFSLLEDNPGAYAQFAIALYEKGKANMGKDSVEPRSRVRQYSPPSGSIDPVDWLTMASMRDSENWFLSFDSVKDNVRVNFAAATTPMEMAWWFTRAGYSDVREDANFVGHQRDTRNMERATQLFNAGYRVCLLIDYQMVDDGTQSQSGSAILLDRHWVALTSPIRQIGGKVNMTIFTWGKGDTYQVPQKGVLTQNDFLMNYYGYVAAKP
jgi:hypothetical protein